MVTHEGEGLFLYFPVEQAEMDLSVFHATAHWHAQVLEVVDAIPVPAAPIIARVAIIPVAGQRVP